MANNQNTPMANMVHDITLAEAATLTSNYRNNNPGETTAVLFNKAAVLDILNQTGCEGLRIYFAEETNGTRTTVLVGADSSENDMFTGELKDHGKRCPTQCSSGNPLNQ